MEFVFGVCLVLSDFHSNFPKKKKKKIEDEFGYEIRTIRWSMLVSFPEHR